MTEELKISAAENKDREDWNNFVVKNYPPIGAFMASWEWGEFQKNLGRDTKRYLVTINSKLAGVFTLVKCRLPLGQSYGYAPRGPVLDNNLFDTDEKKWEFLKQLADWVKINLPEFFFIRLEPPWEKKIILKNSSWAYPDYYIQPKYNLAINLERSETEILAQFHSSTRSNVKKAERKDVTAEVKMEMSAGDWDHFFDMAQDTVSRNAGKKIYPDRSYFETVAQTIPCLDSKNDGGTSLLFFCGWHNGQPAALNLVLFFGDTATYLFGASYTKDLASKVTTYLHWQALKEAKKRGYKYYDLGGIDEKLWPSLTTFKRRFGGKEFEYIGNLDLILRPFVYRAYNWTRKIKH